MAASSVDRVKGAIGSAHFSDIRRARTVNHDGQLVEWIDIVHQGFVTGPDVSIMNRVVEILWDDLQEEGVVPVVNFIDINEDRPLEAAE